jgi:hypothetical protein
MEPPVFDWSGALTLFSVALGAGWVFWLVVDGLAAAFWQLNDLVKAVL